MGLGAANAAPAAKLNNKAAVLKAAVIFNVVFNACIILPLAKPLLKSRFAIPSAAIPNVILSHRFPET